MKKILAIVIFTTIAIQVRAQAPADEKPLQAAVIRFFDALTVLDAAGIRAGVTKDFTLIEDGLIWNQDSLINHIQPMKGRGIKRSNTFKFTKAVQKGDMAWIAYYNTADLAFGEKKKTINWLESVVLVKEAGQWKIQLLHNTLLK